MRIRTHKTYEKMWAKLNAKEQARVSSALRLFLSSSDAGSLRLHQLKGEYYPQYSLSAGGDLRLHFLKSEPDIIVLMMVGTHSQLYG